MLMAAKAADPVATLHAHSRRHRSSPEELQRRRENREARERWRAIQKEQEEQRKEAVAALAALLIDGLGEEIHAFIEHLEVIDFAFLRKSGLEPALLERRPDLRRDAAEEDEDDVDGDLSEEPGRPGYELPVFA